MEDWQAEGPDADVFDDLPAPVVCFREGTIIYANEPAAALLGAPTTSEVIGSSIFDFIHPLDRIRIANRLRWLKPRKGAYPVIEMLIRTRQGDLRGVSASARTSNRLRQGIVAVLMDITHRRLKTYLQETERNIVRLFENTTDIYYRIDAQGKILMASPAVERILGYRSDEMLGQDSSVFYADPDDRERFLSVLRRDKSVADYEVQLRSKHGALVDASISSHALYDEAGNYIAVEGVIRDLTERKQLERKLHVLATTDELTGISNRRIFFKLATQALHRASRHGRQLVLLILDIDWFKEINDRYGHLGGDEALRAFTLAVKDELREIDLFGRLGGEEFGVVLEDCPPHEGESVGQRIRLRVEGLQVSPRDGEILRMSVSIGATCNRLQDARIESLMDRADQALYRAKSDGRNCLRWYADTR